MMGLCMSFVPELSLKPEMEKTMEIHCNICGAGVTHDDTETCLPSYHCAWKCPNKILVDLRREARRLEERHNIDCPKCRGGKVGVNKGDAFECRSCHAQFTRIPGGVVPCTGERLMLIDEKPVDLDSAGINVWVMSQQGQGKFPEDEFLPNIRRSERASKKITRILASMRKLLDESEIYFDGQQFVTPSPLGKMASDILAKYKYA